MSIYLKSNSPYYQYDHQILGHRFYGSTETSSKKEAEALERQLKIKHRLLAEEAKHNKESPLTVNTAVLGYWHEIGKHHVCSDDTHRALTRLIAYFGKDKRLDEITHADAAGLIAWRRKQTRWGKKKLKSGQVMATVSAATVNRDTTAVLKKLIRWAKDTTKEPFRHEPTWRKLMLKEVEERPRELQDDEGQALDKAIRPDFWPWLEFARLTGMRRGETLIRWENVNMFSGQITTIGKGGKPVHTPITSGVRAILEQCRGHNNEWVFTFVAKRNFEGRIKGQRYPITYDGSTTEWERARKRSGIKNFRFHDIRHDVATKLLRHTKNMKLVQQALNHSDIKVTARYAHVLDSEVSAALEELDKSRTSSRTPAKDVA